MCDLSVLITTYNRAAWLRDTLASLARARCDLAWETVVVDNNCTDDTRQVVLEAQATFPAPLHYLFERTPGKYSALNSGIERSAGRIIANTDDDVTLPADWLQQAVAALERYQCDFVGGPVYPTWEAPPPEWIDVRDAMCGKVLALQDHGPEPREYGCDGISWPLGVNVAYRRDAFDRAGLFDGRLGRVAGTLRNQSQREWHLRARRAGLRGMYVPQMFVHHFVGAERLTRRYFYDWFYWHGISRAIMHDAIGTDLLEPETNVTASQRPQLLGAPVSLWYRTARAGISAASRWVQGRPDAALRYELQIPFLIGVVRQRLRHRHAPPPRVPLPRIGGSVRSAR
jgi:glycosyltransferase involved in cell wall biosynthesis